MSTEGLTTEEPEGPEAEQKERERMKLDDVTGQVIDAAIKVHTALGPGLMESAYEGCLLFELHRRDLRVRSQVELPPLHEAQLITYLKLSDKPVGLLINFNTTHLKDGIQRKINHRKFVSGDQVISLPASLPPVPPVPPL